MRGQLIKEKPVPKIYKQMKFEAFTSCGWFTIYYYVGTSQDWEKCLVKFNIYPSLPIRLSVHLYNVKIQIYHATNIFRREISCEWRYFCTILYFYIFSIFISYHSFRFPFNIYVSSWFIWKGVMGWTLSYKIFTAQLPPWWIRIDLGEFECNVG